ncbi:MAG: hypothetical protein J0H14_14055 [Alphaproteobacteria bacterium]|nr:hypothetical protein [Alphaproteobacteria bacterium]
MSDAVFDPTLICAPAVTVIHPLDDAPEEKLFRADLGRMPLTRPLKLALLSLQAHLALILGLIAWRLLSLTGVAGRAGVYSRSA